MSKIVLTTCLAFFSLAISASASAISGKVERVYISDDPAGNYMFASVQSTTGGLQLCYHVSNGSDMGAAMMDAYTAQVNVSMACDSSSKIVNFYSIRGQ